MVETILRIVYEIDSDDHSYQCSTIVNLIATIVL